MKVDQDRAKSIFLNAAEIAPPDEREAYLVAECGNDKALRQEIEELLRHHVQARGFLDVPPPVLAATIDVPSCERPGTQIGTYKLLQQIGEGGMGTVYMAEQTQPVQRRVALKLIKAGMDSRQVIARFEAERQALALMDHVNIARVFDAGATEAGRPYFVMELVHGVPITKYCDDNLLTPRERLELFVPVCQAIQHAHQKGIIHRDIKPSNVMVTLYDGKPVPKVIDFGVAKATEQKLTERTLFTQYGTMIGTLEYMSPEQAEMSALGVDTRSDIYSLGVLLYELLTGSTPLTQKRMKEAAYAEILRMIKEEEPPKPSTRLSDSGEALASLSAQRKTEPAKLTKLVKGELDWIVMKTLEKDRNRRYETANGFAADVQRYLNDEAVQACPPSAGYRFKKFVRRNKGPVLAAAALLATLVAGFVGTAVGLVRADVARRAAEASAEEERHAKEREAAQLAVAVEQRRKAEAARDRTRAALDAMTSEEADDALAAQSAVTAEQKKFLLEVLTYYREFAGEQPEDMQARRRSAASAYKVALIEFRLGRLEESAAASRQARDGYAVLVAEYPAAAEDRAGLARSHNVLARALLHLGRNAAGEAELQRAQTLLKQLATEFPALPEYRLEAAQGHTNLGIALRRLDRHAAAEAEHRQALALVEPLVRDFPAKSEYRAALASCRHSLGHLYSGLRRRREAEAEFRQAQVVREKLVADFPAETKFRLALANSHSDLGFLYAGHGQYDQAAAEYRTAQTLRAKLAADFPAVPQYRLDLATSHNYLGQFLGVGQPAEAEAEYRQAIALLAKLVADFPTNRVYRAEWATSHSALATLYSRTNQPARAEERYRVALALQEKLAADFPAVRGYRQQLATTHNNLGLFFSLQGQLEAARAEFQVARDLRQKLVDEFPNMAGFRVSLGGDYCNLGNLLGRTDRPAESLEWFDRAIRTLRPIYESEPRDITVRQYLQNSYNGRAAAHIHLNQPARAVEDWGRIIELDPAFQVPQLFANRVASRLKAGQVAEAVAEIAELAKHPKWSAQEWLLFATAYARASTTVSGKKDEYAARAVELLGRAIKAGFADAGQLAKDKVIDPLRDRADFQKLLAEMKRKGPP